MQPSHQMIGIKHNRPPIAIFRPLPWQIAPWRDKSEIILLTGSAGGGKSRLAAEKVHGFCKKYPGAMGIILRKTRDSMTNSTVLFMDKTVIGNDKYVNHWPSKHRFEYINGSIMAYGGMADDAQREQIRSIGQAGGGDIIWLEEANRFTEDDFNELLGRLRGSAADWRQIILTTNPDRPTHWIKRRLMDGGEASVYYSRALDNTYNPDGYINTLRRLTGILEKRLNRGLWIQAEGAVYEEFSDELHVIDPFQVPSDWRRVRAIDFGYTNPFVCQWWAIDNDGRMYLYREIYETGRIVEDHAKEIVRLSEGEYIEATVADHDAEDRATLERYGVFTIPAQKEITPGIQGVQQRLRKAGDSKPRLFIMRGATVREDLALISRKLPTSTLEEFSAYIWPENKDGRPVKEVPIDLFNHGMDAMRYMARDIDEGMSSVGVARIGG